MRDQLPLVDQPKVTLHDGEDAPPYTIQLNSSSISNNGSPGPCVTLTTPSTTTTRGSGSGGGGADPAVPLNGLPCNNHMGAGGEGDVVLLVPGGLLAGAGGGMGATLD